MRIFYAFKSDMFNIFKIFLAYVENQFSNSLKVYVLTGGWVGRVRGRGVMSQYGFKHFYNKRDNFLKNLSIYL